MTMEDAIQWLTDIKNNITENWSQEVAIDMAIEALSADAEYLKAYYDGYNTAGIEAQNTLADMVSVVRCKDCRYYWGNLSEDDTDEMYGECRWNSDEMPNDDDFCSYGERAEQTEYQLPGHDEVMDALDKLKLRGDKDE